MQKLITLGLLLVALQGFAIKDVSIENRLDDYRHASKAPSAQLAIIDAAAHERTYQSDHQHNPNRDLFQIGSLTKLYMSTLILMLEQDELLDLDNSLNDIARRYRLALTQKQLRQWGPITVRQLLNMTAGIPNYTEDKWFLKTIEIHPQKDTTVQTLLRRIEDKPLDFRPGSNWHYSDSNYLIVGLIIEAVTKQSIDTVLTQRILRPLGLKNTFYMPQTLPDQIMERMVHGYGQTYVVSKALPPLVPGPDQTKFNLSYAQAAGAMIASARDVAVFGRALFRGQLLHPEQMKSMMHLVCMDGQKTCKAGQIVDPKSPSLGFGLGIASMRDVQLGRLWFYRGSTPGYYAILVWSPQTEQSIALNTAATTLGGAANLKFVLQLLKG